MTRLVITDPASNDLREIWNHIAENSYLDYADETLDNLLAECELLCTQPKMGRDRSELAIDLRMFPGSRYNIYYRYRECSVFILHIVDAARDFRRIEFS